MKDVNGQYPGASDYRIIPSIEQLRQRPALRALESRYGRHAIVEALREEAELLRQRLAEGRPGQALDLPSDPSTAAEHLELGVERRLRQIFAGSLHSVINATGVIIHTNLGRAPLSNDAIDRLVEVARGYSNLEFDLTTGRRGRRDVHASGLLARLTGAESALVVNNNAAATLLILSALASRREVVISRGELVEIGGGFRVPEVMAQSGALLREVGTTNKTRIADYEAAIDDRTALILRVHRSNFRIEGFTEQPSLEELVALGRRAGVSLVEDLGSGWLGTTGLLSEGPRVRRSEGRRSDPRTFGPSDVSEPASAGARTSAGAPSDFATLRDEPTVQASIAVGLDLVCFSGDKLLGGPQAGLIVGRTSLVDRLRRHPLMRALRVDKLTYAALEGTLLDYLAGRAIDTVPVARMLAMPADVVEARARAVIEAAGQLERCDMEVRAGVSMVGGGSAPGLPIPTRLLVLRPKGCDAATLEAALRSGRPPVIGRVEQELVLLDLRTVQPEEDQRLAAALRAAGRAV
jgi:L-seryl-tRNA(Ser) seleniumtransferase